MIRWIDGDPIGLSTVLKEQGDVMKQSGLIVLNGEVVVRLALQDQVVGNFVLG